MVKSAEHLHINLREFETKIDKGPKGLFELDGKEKTALARRVQGAGGLVRAYVHPFFYIDRINKFLLSEMQKMKIPTNFPRKDLEIAARVLERFKQPAKGNPPSLLFEESSKYDETRLWLEAAVNTTKQNMPFMLKSQDNFGLLEGHRFRELNSLLEELGVQKIEVAGLHLSETPPGEQQRFDRCVGHVITGLKSSRSFSVEIAEDLTSRV